MTNMSVQVKLRGSRIALVLCFYAASVLCETKPNENKLNTVVSPGAWITVLDDVVIFTHWDYLFFPIPARPTLETPEFYECKGSAICQMNSNNNALNAAAFNLSKAMSQMFSMSGLPESKMKTLQWPNTLYKHEGAKNYSINEMTMAVMDSEAKWMDHVNHAATNPRPLGRQKKAILPILGKIAALAPPILKVFKNLFTSQNSIIKGLKSTIAQTLPKYREFLKLFPVVNEFISKAEENADLRKQSAQSAKEIFKEIPQGDPPLPLLFLGSHTNLFYISKAVSDLAALQQQTIVQAIHAHAVSSCRSHEIPIPYISQSMLFHRLVDFDGQLPPDLELALPPSNVMAYYKLQNADCTFGEDSGLIVVKVPVKPKEAHYRMFKFQGLSFRRGEETCSFDLDSQYVVKDETTNDVFVITDVDEENCNPASTGKCLVPSVNAAGTKEYPCVNAIMTGESQAVLKELCKFTCMRGLPLNLVQPSPGTIIATNLPHVGSKILCGESSLNIEHELSVGAMEITLGCECILMIESRVVARSTARICIKTAQYVGSFHGLLPVQWMKENGPSVGSSIANIDDYLDWEWNTKAEFSVSEWSENQIAKTSVLTTSGQLVQMSFIIYILYRLHAQAAVLAVVLTRLQRAQAADNVTCDLPLSTELVLYITLFVVTLNVFCAGIRKLFGELHKIWLDAIDRAVAVKDIEMNPPTLN